MSNGRDVGSEAWFPDTLCSTAGPDGGVFVEDLQLERLIRKPQINPRVKVRRACDFNLIRLQVWLLYHGCLQLFIVVTGTSGKSDRLGRLETGPESGDCSTLGAALKVLSNFGV